MLAPPPVIRQDLSRSDRSAVTHRRPGRRRVLADLGAAALSACLPWSLSACARSARSLNLASHVWPGYELLFFARDQGWLDGGGVRLVEMPGASASLHALAAGLVDGAALTLDEVLRARADGIPLVVVLVFDISAGADMVLGRPDMTGPVDLAGRRVGVEPGGSGALLLALALEQAGLDRDSIETVALTPPEQLAAWRAGRVDALVCHAPVANHVLAAGARPLFDSRALPETVVDVLAVTPEAARRQRDALGRLIAAHFRALAHFHASALDTAYRLAPRLGMSPRIVLDTYKGLLLLDPRENRRLLGGEHPALLEIAGRLSARMARAGLLASADVPAGLIDASLLPSPDRSTA